MTPDDAPPDPIPAVAYVRMSTEHQECSTRNQMAVTREYARRRGLEIVKEYSDEGGGSSGPKGPAVE
jgi:DNA invertase Pin-like site-specific DNA recombinase